MTHEEEFYKHKYQKTRKIGEGTYAVVYEGIATESKRIIAIKKIKLGAYSSEIEVSALREIKHLQELKHPNIIELIDVFSVKTNINLVLEYLNADLETLIKEKSVIFMAADIKSWMLMLLRGLDCCHKNWILHRDLKPNNLLIDSKGVLKIADFGLARDYGMPNVAMTSQVVTRWYRPPELLFGAKYYTAAVDIWSAGCIFAELMLRTPYLPGDSDMGQLNTIFRALGTPTMEDWPGMTFLPDYMKFPVYMKPPLKQLFSAATDDALSLLQKMLIFDPSKRITTIDALANEYFTNQPRPSLPEHLPKVSIKSGMKKTEAFLQSKDSLILATGIEPKKLF